MMIDTNTPEIRLRNITQPMPSATSTGTSSDIPIPNHCSWNGVHRNEPWLMQHKSVLAPGSAFQSMKSGTGVADPCCKLVGLASFIDIAVM